MNQLSRRNWGSSKELPQAQKHFSTSQLQQTGRISWNPEEIQIPPISPGSSQRALARFQANLQEFIWNAAALEGNTFTLPEVITLLDGVTVGGRPLEDEEQILALSEGYNLIAKNIADKSFVLSRDISNQIHALVGRHEAIESGAFRGEGYVGGGGNVRLTDGNVIGGDAAGKDGENLLRDYENLLVALTQIEHPILRATIYFCSATRSQFYFDGNKRTARLMMAGELMMHGYDAINVPYARKLEFNQALDNLFRTNDATELIRFLISCLQVGE